MRIQGHALPPPLLLVLLRRALVLLHVAAEDEGVCGGEGALVAAQRVARRMFQLLVQVEVVFAFAAVRAAVAVEGPLTRVHAHVLDQLVGRFGQVAALLTLVVVAQAMGAHVAVQRGLVRPQSLADAAAVLHLTVRLQVALHGRWTIGGVDAERAHLNSTFHLLWAPKRFTNLEPSGRDGVALLVLQQLLGRLEELVTHVALEHSGDEVDLQVPLVHATRFTHKVTEDALEAFVIFVLSS